MAVMTAAAPGLRAPIGAFTKSVVDARGRVDVRALARALDLPISTLAPALGAKVRWLNENPTAPGAQRSAILLLEIANALARTLGGTRYVALYFKTPQPDFKGETPADQLKAGRLDYLRAYVWNVVTEQPD